MVLRLTILKSLNNGQFKEIYRNSVSYSDSVAIPFENILRVMKFLYPDSIINFQLM